MHSECFLIVVPCICLMACLVLIVACLLVFVYYFKKKTEQNGSIEDAPADDPYANPNPHARQFGLHGNNETLSINSDILFDKAVTETNRKQSI